MSLVRVTAPTDLPVTLAEAKLHLRVDHADDDALITALIEAATGVAESRLNRALLPQTWERVLDDFPDGAIRLGMPPVTSVASVKYLRAADGVEVTIDAAQYSLKNAVLPGWVEPGYQLDWPTDVRRVADAVRVRFAAGYANAATVPREIRQWILLTIGAMYANREALSDGRTAELPSRFVDGLIVPHKVVEL